MANDEIILHDENNAQIMVYSRLDDTPDRATLTEPKRIIGGPATNIQMNCGVYVDPFSGDIYSVNGDTADWMGVWTREQRGNVAPTRELEAPHRAFGVVVDEEAQELFMTIQHPPAVVVWPKLAKDQDAPLRILEGDKTRLASAQGITIDTENQWLYVSNVGATSRNSFNQGWSRALYPGSATWEIPNRILDYIPGSGEFRPPSITVHDLKANGDTAPLRVIQGPLTQLNWPAHISVDVESDELFVTNPVTHEILVFRASASGNVAPIRVLGGPGRDSVIRTACLWTRIATSSLWLISATIRLRFTRRTHRATLHRSERSGRLLPTHPPLCLATSGRRPTTVFGMSSLCPIEWPSRL